ncbi:MAG: peptidoglycan bridge formation glycyltransferase FemA/FemB family protein, partial [Patescibacteria group bacterium]|nr:peptidoglycan bridge formation glycyltransferase FemA/FemB family protein [Patescibacteria group bacterium]
VCENNLTAKLYLAEYKNKTIAANIVLSFGDFCVYLHGASSSEYRNVMAPYLLQWQQILDAKKTGCRAYDFWGIENSQKFVKSKVHKAKNSWSGITRFKKGFGGEERSYVGAYDLVFNWEKYYLYKVFKRIRGLRQ